MITDPSISGSSRRMTLSPLSALSPLDGRYAARCVELREVFSEAGLIRARVRVEVAWLRALAAQPAITELNGLSREALARVAAIATGFTAADAAEVKAIERETNHDVKAVEYLIKRRLADDADWKTRL